MHLSAEFFSPPRSKRNAKALCELDLPRRFGNSAVIYLRCVSKRKDPKEISLGSRKSQQRIYLLGAVRSLRTRKMTTTSATASSINPGAPTSSAKPVLGKAVDVTTIVCVETAI